MSLFEEVGKAYEGFKDGIYLDHEKVPTIGVGYNLRNSDVLEGVLKQFGYSEDSLSKSDLDDLLGKLSKIFEPKDWTEANKSTKISEVNDLLEEYKEKITDAADKAAAEDTFVFKDKDGKSGFDDKDIPKTANEMEPVFTEAIKDFEKKAVARIKELLDYKDSADARVVWDGLGQSQKDSLLSLTYNGGPRIMGEKLATALRDKNWADAYYEIVYGSNKSKDYDGDGNVDGRSYGLQERRGAEGAKFIENLSAADKKKLFDKLKNNKDTIEKYLDSVVDLPNSGGYKELSNARHTKLFSDLNNLMDNLRSSLAAEGTTVEDVNFKTSKVIYSPHLNDVDKPARVDPVPPITPIPPKDEGPNDPPKDPPKEPEGPSTPPADPLVSIKETQKDGYTLIEVYFNDDSGTSKILMAIPDHNPEGLEQSGQLIGFPNSNNHIGEVLRNEDGSVTYRFIDKKGNIATDIRMNGDRTINLDHPLKGEDGKWESWEDAIKKKRLPDPEPPELPPPPPRDPLALDLNGDGIVKTLPISRDIHFDLDNSGFAERTSWVAPEDGLLVLDRNNNNFIDGGAELFGTETLLQNGKYAQHGFEALAEFDINKDGVLDTSDAIYSSLRVWRDANSNGIAEATELKKLADLNIKSVGTAYTNIDTRDTNNVEHREAGTFTYNNATKGITNTLWFESDRRITTPVTELQGNITIPTNIKKLPNVVGFGNTYSLHHAMAVDSSGELQKKVQRFSVELNPGKRRLLLREILVLWTKTETVVAGSRGNKVDATSLAIMESFWGQPALQAEPLGAYADSVNKAYKQLEQSVYTQLMAATHMRDLISLTDFSEINGQWTADYSVAIDVLSGNFVAANEFATLRLVEYIETIRGVNPYSDSLYQPLISELEVAANLLAAQPRGAMLSAFHSHDEIIAGSSNADLLEGFGGNDILNGNIGDDVLNGGDGNDRLYGEDGADTLFGGEGSDLLMGGSGNDTYLYNKGDGDDIISESAGSDTLKFGHGITKDNIIVRRNTYDVMITTENSNLVTVTNLFSYSGEENKDNLIEYFSFSDNSVLTFEQFKKLATIGSNQNDTLLGFNSADVITGKEGHDTLYGFNGNDTLNGGVGNDELVGGAGNDIYVFNAGDGSDVLDESGGFDSVQLGQGIKESDIGVHVNAAGDLEIILSATDKITVKGMVNNSNGTIHLDRSIEQLTFANGAIWNIDRIQRQAMLGTNIGDTIYGFNLNGVIDGKRGPDRLYGRSGNDTYLFNKGDGIDVISDSGGTDIIRFGAGINPDDLLIVRRSASGTDVADIAIENATGNDLVFFTRYGDQITVVNANADAANAIEKIEFANGDVWNAEQIQQRIQHTLNQSNIFIGTNQRFEQLGYYEFSNADTTFIGMGGNDQLIGGRGNDTFIGGDGINVMYGGMGNDNYIVHTSNKREQVIKSFSDRGDRIFLADDISPAEVTVRIIRDTLSDLHLDQSGLRGTNGILTPINIALTTNEGFLLTIENVFNSYYLTQPYAGLDLKNTIEKSGYVEFLNGTRWDYEALLKLALSGTDQIDRILGTIENDEVQGKAGADVIEAFNGNDVLDGGTGDDSLNGGNGNDTYLYSLGDGNDEIYDLGGKDTLKFGAGIKKENVLFTIDNQKMIVSFNNSTDKITISNWDPDNYSAGIIENVVFANGDTLDFDPYNLPRNLLGTNNDDHLIGYYGNDTLEGLSGNDTLWGGAGNDLYILGSSSGHDHISDSGGIDTIYLKDLSSQQSDLVTIYFNQNLVLTVEINAPGGMYAVSSYLDYSSHSIGERLDFKNNASFIENVKFSDGVVWDAEKILREARENSISNGVLVGTDINDVLDGTGLSEILFAGAGDDLLTGGAGDDTLLGKSGNDIYRYARGDGADVIKEESGNDTLELATGINPEDVVISQDGYDIVVNFLGLPNDSIRISQALSNYGFSAAPGPSMIEVIRFADGRIWDAESVIKKTITPVASVNTQGNKVIGTTPFDSEKVVLRNAAGVEIGRVTPSGTNFSISVNNALYSNQSVYVVALDASGIESPALKLIVPDKTAPVAPTASIDKTGTLVSGASESGALIQVKTKSGILLGEAVSDSSGAYSVLLSSAQINKQTLNITAKDAANNLSSIRAITAPDGTAPSAPTAAFDTTGGIISGKAEAGSMVEVKNSSGVLLQKVAADIATGAYTITLSKALINKEIVNVIAIDNAGNASAAKSVTAPDKTPPSAPGAQLNSARKIVSGTAEAGSTVKILDANDVLLKSTVANATTGVYSVTFTTAIAANQVIKVVAVDKSGNTSLPTIIGGVVTPVDTVPPDVPIAQFGSAGEVITGKAEAGSLVEVKSAATGNLLGNVTASATGDYSILLNTPLINKEVVHVTARDAAGNISSIRAIIAPDKTPPALPVMNLDAATKTLTGSSEPGATIIIKNAENNVMGSVKADSVTGNYQLVLNQTLVNGQLLFGTATDDAGNTSASASLQVSGIPSRQIISGLLGSYYGYEQSANGDKDLTRLAQVQTFITGKAADATFIATNFNFGPGTNALGMGANLQSFLKNDAASLSNDPLDTSDSILRFTGKIQLSSGSYNFRVRADDGYSIRINGQTVAEYNANQGATTRTHGAFSVAITGLQDIEIIYWDSGKGHELGIEYKPAGGSYSYLNGSILSTESAQPNLASAQFTSSKTQSEQGNNVLDSWFGSPRESVTHNLVARNQPIKPHAQQLGTLIQSMAAFAPSSGVEGHLSVRSANESPQLLAVGT